MPSAQDLESFNRLRTDDQDAATTIEGLPELPDDVKRRFPSMIKWHSDLKEFMTKNVAIAIRGGQV